MNKFYSALSGLKPFCLQMKFYFLFFILFSNYSSVSAQSDTLKATADSYVRNGAYASNNYGNDTSLAVKSSTSSGYTRSAYLKFSLSNISSVGSAKLRIYGRNTETTTSITISVYSISVDSWSESTITYNNAPTSSSSDFLNSVGVSNAAKYYEIDVTNFVKDQFSGDKIVSFNIKDAATKNTNLLFNSRQNPKNAPQLIISRVTGGSTSPSNALLFVENPDRFPSNDYFVASRVQTPWSRDKVTYNRNHDSLIVRIHNNGINSLIIKSFSLSNTSRWKIEKLKGITYSASSLPITIASGSSADLTVRFIAANQATRVKISHDTLVIASNDDKFPSKNVFLNGVWQKQGEGSNEPYAQEVISAFGYKTSTGFSHTDPDKGDSTKLKGNEIKPSFFVRADISRPVFITQMSAYHGCCTQTERMVWYTKGSSTLNTVFTHAGKDAQSVLPRKNGSNSLAEGSFSTSTAFGLRIGSVDNTDASKNPGKKIGIRVWKAIDPKGNIIPNTYIVSNDYLGSEFTNYDYNDNTYLVRNVRPEKGSASYSELKATPSALDFGEKTLSTSNSLQLNLSSLGKTYSDGSSDPVIKISLVAITGENKSEFTTSLPATTSLNPQQSTSLTVNFKPVSQGLKIADLLVYYNNSQSPLRVPLYGIAKASGTTVTAHYRINSGSTTSLTINGKTWSADNQYSFDNLEPFTNSGLKQIAGTDDDALYLKEQSSNDDRKPFRYEFPVSNGSYVVRLHFAELYWGAPGGGINGGAGSRVMNISLENQLKLANFDVTQEVGGATAIVKNFPVTVSDGKLSINFTSNVNRPMVCAVEVYSFRSAAARSMSNDSAIVLQNNLEKIKAYPNPVQGRLNLTFPDKYKGNTNVQILDATGRTYNIGKYKIPAGGSNIEVDIQHYSLKPGFYFLKIVSETNPVETIKLVVTK